MFLFPSRGGFWAEAYEGERIAELNCNIEAATPITKLDSFRRCLRSNYHLRQPHPPGVYSLLRYRVVPPRLSPCDVVKIEGQLVLIRRSKNLRALPDSVTPSVAGIAEVSFTEPISTVYATFTPSLVVF